MQFSFCTSCGSYLAPDAGTVIVTGGFKRLVCRDCQSRYSPVTPVGNKPSADDAPITTAEAFEQRYKL
jgi:DNA-directed RNA polymerase subunit M/transcription elongation factor TFIIS